MPMLLVSVVNRIVAPPGVSFTSEFITVPGLAFDFWLNSPPPITLMPLGCCSGLILSSEPEALQITDVPHHFVIVLVVPVPVTV
jgi:hypothetical protein